ncbi:MAG: pseudouridine synthase [bacterium]
MRLNKYLAECGVASRRKCDELIAAGKVSVNGQVARHLGVKVDEFADTIRLQNTVVKPNRELEYILLNKPKDVITTVSDDRGRRTVLDIVSPTKRVFPVGRLDRDTTGVLLLTNDGELAHRLTHPKFKIDKTYEVKLNAPLKWSDQCRLQSGVELEEGITSECRVEIPEPKDKTVVRMTIHQGWKRQVRRMFAALGYHVVQLKRVRFAFIDLSGLKRGQSRHLSSQEVARLRALCHGD